jgi:hypothetical protein
MQGFLVRHPVWSGVVVVLVGLCFAAIPLVGTALCLLVIAGGMIGIAAATHRSVGRELPPSPEALSLPAGRPGPAPAGVFNLPSASRSQSRPGVGDQRSVGELASVMALDDRDRPLDEQVEVAGETHYSRHIRAVFKDHEMAITAKGATLREVQCVLVPEPWNDYDPNAVAVLIGTHHVGYLPAELAESYAWPLRRIAEAGRLVPGRARVWAKDESGMIRARVTILIPATEDL